MTTHRPVPPAPELSVPARSGLAFASLATFGPALTVMLASLVHPAAAAPLVLYDPGSSTPTTPSTDLKSSTTTTATSPQPCGLTTPCTDLNTAAQASLAAPLASNFQYGMSGVATAGVSNHGQGGSLGVLGWAKLGDNTTLYVGVSVGATPDMPY
jgi:hypothetical protein